MSKLACRLFAQRKPGPENEDALLRVLFGEPTRTAPRGAIEDALCDLAESHPLGPLQMYYMQEHFLRNRPKKAIGKEIKKTLIFCSTTWKAIPSVTCAIPTAWQHY